MKSQSAIWADLRLLFFAIGACTVAAAVGLVFLQNHTATQYRRAVQTNEMAAIANSIALDAWAMNLAVANSQGVTTVGAAGVEIPDLAATWDRIAANLRNYDEDSSVGAPAEVTALLDPIITKLQAAFQLQAAGRVAEAVPLLNQASGQLATNLLPVHEAAARYEQQAIDTRKLTTVASILIFATALGVIGLFFWQYRHARRRIEAAEAQHEILRRSEARFRPLVQNSSDVIIVLDGHLEMQYLSPSIERMLSYSFDQLSHMRTSEFVHPHDVARLEAFYHELASRPHYTATMNIRVFDRHQNELYLDVVGTNLLDNPDVNGIVLNARDVTERHAMELQLRHQAFHDSLTGLANRLRFTERLEHSLLRGREDGRGKPFCVLYMDLDHFKNVNDELGHGIGDALLRDVAHRLLACLRPSDTCARLGGDEFAILLDTTETAGGAARVAERMLGEMSSPFEIAGHVIRLTASIGIVVVNPLTISADEVIRNADVAMYDAKQNGRNCAHLYQPDMHVKLVEKLRLANDLHQAVEAGEFLVYYQPVIDLQTERTTGFEALARWEHPVRGILLPSEFIALAEEVGAIQALGEKVLREACRKAAFWNHQCEQGTPLTMSVNVSARQIEKAGFPDIVKRVLADTSLDAKLLILEITESLLVRNPIEVSKTLGELKQIGVRIALDDFGTGFSSLNSLKDFPIDILKIDKSFTDELDLSDKGRLLVQTVIELGTTLHMEIVAEGIERADQLSSLNVLHCSAGQGYFFAEPLDEAEADDLVTSLIGDPGAKPALHSAA